jgi:DNA-3-methyladenine glycosylase
VGPEIGQDPLLVAGTSSRLGADFFQRDVLEVAPDLLGKVLVRRLDDCRLVSARITEVEAYRGTEDLACHASRGLTPRTEVMFGPGGYLYVYLIYGMYWMLNFVTGEMNIPQAVLIRGTDAVNGPGRLTRYFDIRGDFNGECLWNSQRLWLEDHRQKVRIETGPRIGVGYAGDYWASRPWRFLAGLDP